MTEATTPPQAKLRSGGPEALTIPALWHRATSSGRTDAAYLVERADGSWAPVTWEDAGAIVAELANGLLARGVRKGDAFAILGRNALEWAAFDFALGLIGAISAPIYSSSSPQDCLYVARHSEAVGALVEDDEQRAKLAGFDGQILRYADLEQLRAEGRTFAAAEPDALAAAADAVGEEDVFTYIYTSGTTGPPKACMIRHRNYVAMAQKGDAHGETAGPGDTMLLWLPLAHNFGRLMQIAGAHRGYTIAFLADPLRAAEVLPRLRPTVMPSVPRLFEKIHTTLVAVLEATGGPRGALIRWALGVGRRWSARVEAGRRVPPLLALQHRLADRLVFAKVRERIGFDRLRYANSGGAPLARELAVFFHALGILIVEGYGLSECTTAATVNHRDAFRFGTVGQALPGVELRIAADGEILVRSNTVFAGYYKDPEATREVLDEDGWLHTGDVGELDADGFLTITDRKKDILVTAGGKNVAPQNLENDLKTSPYVSQAIVVGDRRPYVAALVTLDADEIGRWAGSQGLARDVASLAGDARVRALVQEVVDEVNRPRSRYEQIKRFAILPRDFGAEEGELTPTLKLRRRVVQQHFAAEIEALYAATAGETAQPMRRAPS
ncbi:MAG TPA: long-chain fatty acid--CoA ligase [Gaiellaceae bacterium]|nr:long-chain fatty acid--CoA ligase [Gaiellaceae bacterium]